MGSLADTAADVSRHNLWLRGDPRIISLCLMIILLQWIHSLALRVTSYHTHIAVTTHQVILESPCSSNDVQTPRSQSQNEDATSLVAMTLQVIVEPLAISYSSLDHYMVRVLTLLIGALNLYK